MSNIIRIGATRTGKSTAVTKDIVEYAIRGEGGAAVFDPHSTMAKEIAGHLVSHGIPFLYEKLAETDRVLAFPFMKKSKHKDPWLQQAENEESIRAFGDILVRRRGMQGMQNTPLIEEWIMAALELWMHQNEPVRLTELQHCFRPHHKTFIKLVQNCENDYIKWKFHNLTRMSETALRGETGAAQRILNAVFRSPAFALRCDGNFPIGEFLDEGGIVLFEGKSLEGKSISDDAIRTSFGALGLQIIQHVRTRTGGKRIRMVLDEANNFGLVGWYEMRALAEGQKMGFDVDISVQSLDFPTPEILDGVLTNCQRHEWFRPGAARIGLAGSLDLGVPSIDEYKIHHKDVRGRQINIGWEDTTTTGKGSWDSDEDRSGSSTSENNGYRAKFGETTETTDHYQGLNDQVLIFQRDLMRLKVGERFVKDVGEVWKEYVTPLKEPYPCMPGLKRKRTEAAIDQIRQGAEFTGGIAIENYSDSSITPQSLNSGSEQRSSTITRLRQDVQKNSNNGNGTKSDTSEESS